jgi:hypothetical protein
LHSAYGASATWQKTVPGLLRNDDYLAVDFFDFTRSV